MEISSQLLDVVADLVGSSQGSGISDRIGKGRDVLEQIDFLGTVEQGIAFLLLIAVFSLSEYGTDACIGVLRVIDRVVVGLGPGQRKIEIQMGIQSLGKEELSCAVDTDVIAQFS